MPLARLTGWMRPVAALLALAGTLALSACGGGSGSVNNPNTPTNPDPVATLTTLPAGVVVAYSGVPATIQIVGGVAPYTALSNNSAVLAVPFNVSGSTLVLVANPVAVGTDVPVAITIADQSGQSVIANVTVRYAPLFENGLVITPSSANCGGTNICDGDTATVTAVATGVGSAPLPGRQIRFDAVFGPFGIMTSNPALPLAPTLTVVTDSTGSATVQIQTTANAPTQTAQIRATDVATGQSMIANFIVQRTTGTDNLSVIPPNASITGSSATTCSTGFVVDYYIFGGTPPYSITSSFPTTVTITPTVVGASGGFFRVVTNGSCVNPVTFTILDAAGKVTTATLANIPGTGTGAGAGVLTLTPSSVSVVGASAASCGRTFNIIITGGTPPFNVSLSPSGTVGPQTDIFGAKSVDISNLGIGTTTVVVLDSGIGTLQQIKTATISCSAPT